MALLYETGGEYYGPTYASHRINGAEVTVTFEHVGSGLTFKMGDQFTEDSFKDFAKWPDTAIGPKEQALQRITALQGFALAGEDKVFHWATARIVDDHTVMVTSKAVPQPVAVRYAWDDRDCRWANLFNKEAYPALPFRTDDWTGKETKREVDGDDGQKK